MEGEPHKESYSDTPEVTLSGPLHTSVDMDEVGEELSLMNKALRIDCILKVVLGHLPLEDVTRSRLVNKFWNQVATRVIIPQAPVVQLHSNQQLQKFTKLMDNSLGVPYKKFELSESFINNSSTKKTSPLRNFMEDLAPTMIHLGIDGRRQSLRISMKMESLLKGLRFPNLKSFHVSFHSSSNVDMMIEVLEQAPELETMSLECDSDQDSRQSFLQLLEHVPWNNIRHLKLRNETEDVDFRRILELEPKLQLKSFEGTICTWSGRITEQVERDVHEFMERQRHCLKTLKLYFKHLDPVGLRLNLPQMSKLTTLEIKTIWYGVPNRHFIASLPSFPQQFPHLRSLTITGIDWSHFTRLLGNGVRELVPLESVKVLKLDLGIVDGILVEADARALIGMTGQLFPNVETLGIPCHREVVEAIQVEGAWKKLQHLILLCAVSTGHNVDRALTGFSFDFCARMSGLSLGLPQARRELETIDILNFLHGLRCLELDTKGVCLGFNQYFSEISCRHVLLRLKNLKCLNLLKFEPSDEISEKVLREMRSKFEVLHIKPRVRGSR